MQVFYLCMHSKSLTASTSPGFLKKEGFLQLAEILIEGAPLMQTMVASRDCYLEGQALQGSYNAPGRKVGPAENSAMHSHCECGGESKKESLVAQEGYSLKHPNPPTAPFAPRLEISGKHSPSKHVHTLNLCTSDLKSWKATGTLLWRETRTPLLNYEQFASLFVFFFFFFSIFFLFRGVCVS